MAVTLTQRFSRGPGESQAPPPPRRLPDHTFRSEAFAQPPRPAGRDHLGGTAATHV